MGTMWIPTPEQEAEIQARIGEEVALAVLKHDMSDLLAAAASNPGKTKAIVKAAASLLVTTLTPFAASIPLAPAALALLPKLIDQL